jgi:hypothetical protein
MAAERLSDGHDVEVCQVDTNPNPIAAGLRKNAQTPTSKSSCVCGLLTTIMMKGLLPMDKPKLSVVGATEVPNPFDIEKLRLNPSFVETAGVKKRVTTVPVKKPSKQDFIRVRPEP